MEWRSGAKKALQKQREALQKQQEAVQKQQEALQKQQEALNIIIEQTWEKIKKLDQSTEIKAQDKLQKYEELTELFKEEKKKIPKLTSKAASKTVWADIQRMEVRGSCVSHPIFVAAIEAINQKPQGFKLATRFAPETESEGKLCSILDFPGVFYEKNNPLAKETVPQELKLSSVLVEDLRKALPSTLEKKMELIYFHQCKERDTETISDILVCCPQFADGRSRESLPFALIEVDRVDTNYKSRVLEDKLAQLVVTASEQAWKVDYSFPGFLGLIWDVDSLGTYQVILYGIAFRDNKFLCSKLLETGIRGKKKESQFNDSLDKILYAMQHCADFFKENRL